MISGANVGLPTESGALRHYLDAQRDSALAVLEGLSDDHLRTPVLHICLTEVRIGFPTEQRVQRVGVGVGGLLDESVEQQAAALGVAAVESEGELVEVVGQLVLGDGEVHGACEPSFE